MSVITLKCSPHEDLNRVIRLRSSPKTTTSKASSASSNSASSEQIEKNNKNDDEEEEQQQLPPGAESLPAYIQIENVASIFLEPNDCSPQLRRDIWASSGESGCKTSIPLNKILRFFMQSSEEQLIQLDLRDDFLLSGANSLNVHFQKNAQEVFLAPPSHTVLFTIRIVDPRNCWEISENNENSKENDNNNKITTEPLNEVNMWPCRFKPVFSSHDAAGVAELIQESKNIVVLVGAGMSRGDVSLGEQNTPDFRSKDGLYSKLEKYDLPSPESVFTLDYFSKHPQTFYQVSSDMKLWPGSAPPTRAHQFIKMIQDKGKLLLSVTQNIDCLEHQVGIRDDKLVEAHGSYASCSCISKKKHKMSLERCREISEVEGKIPICEVENCGQYVKPDVVFFGEALPSSFFEAKKRIMVDADLVLTIGTSLAVYPFAGLADPPTTKFNQYPRVLINMEKVGNFKCLGDAAAPKDPAQIMDVFLPGDCQKTCVDIATHLGWKEELYQSWEEGKKRALVEKNKKGVEGNNNNNNNNNTSSSSASAATASA